MEIWIIDPGKIFLDLRKIMADKLRDFRPFDCYRRFWTGFRDRINGLRWGNGS